MEYILGIETSGALCSIAFSSLPEGNIQVKEMVGEKIHGEYITVLIQELMNELDISPHQLLAVAVSSGPGSYTGLRVGMSVAKGFCLALGIPLICLPTLEVLALGIQNNTEINMNFFCPVLHARANEIYLAVYDTSLSCILPACALEVQEAIHLKALEVLDCTTGGPGLPVFMPALTSFPKLIPIENIQLSARWVVIRALHYYSIGKFTNLALSEPFYLKPVRVTTPKIV